MYMFLLLKLSYCTLHVCCTCSPRETGDVRGLAKKVYEQSCYCPYEMLMAKRPCFYDTCHATR